MKTPTITCFLLVALVVVMASPLLDGGVAHASPEDEERLRALVRGDIPHDQKTPRDMPEIRRLLDNGVSPNAPDGFGRTAVHYAAGAQRGNDNATEMLILLLQYGGECCMQDNQGDTPLHYAAAEGTNYRLPAEARIRALLNNGADLNQANRKGYTPLHFSAKTDYFGVQQGDLVLLLKGGADPNRVAGDGNTALHLAVGAPVLLDNGHGHRFSQFQLQTGTITTWSDDAPVIRELLAAGANPDAFNAAGLTPLLVVLIRSENYIAKSDIVAATETLLSGGANPNATTPKGATPLHLVLRIPNEWSRPDQRLLEALLGAGADPDRKNRRGDTPLHAAVRTERGEGVIETLLQAAANPCLRNDREQKLPSELARVNGQSSVSALLERAGSGRDGCRTAEENRLDLDRTARRQVESCLNTLGYDTGSSDGLFDSRTNAAIRAWQEAHGGEYGEVTGYLGSRNELDALLEGCRVVLTPICRGEESGCWLEITNRPGCYLWHHRHSRQHASHPNKPVTWSGECSGGLAQGRGTIGWPSGGTASGVLTDGKEHGHWVGYESDGTVWEGHFVNGEGRWVKRGSSGSAASPDRGR